MEYKVACKSIPTTFFSMYRFINFVCFVLSLAMFFLAPLRYDTFFCNACGAILFISLVSYFRVKHKKNYFDFDTIFLFISILMFYLYPIVVYPVTKSTEILLFDFDVSKISKGTALSTVGLCSYLLGSIGIRKRINNRGQRRKLKLLRTGSLTFASIVCFFIYVALGGWFKMRMAYQNDHSVQSGSSEYFYLLSYITLLCVITIWFNNEHKLSPGRFNIKYLPKVQILYLLTFISMMLFAGGRTVPMQLVLCCMGLYTYFYRPIGLWMVITLMGLGILMMFGILLIRSQSEILESGDDERFVMFTDLMLVVRNSYDCISYVEKNGITLGISMLSPLLAAVPFAQGLLLPLLGISKYEASSAKLLTSYALGDNSQIGVGTNIVTDLYIAFGIIGVVVGMYMLGNFIARILKSGKSDMYSLASYAVMVSYAVYLVRAEYLFFVRALVWTLIIIYLVKYKNKSRV